MGLFGSSRKGGPGADEDAGKYESARDAYLGGRFKVVTTETIALRDINWVFGVVIGRGYNPDNAFFGVIHRAMEAGADAIVGYRESIAFHPDGDKHYTCYGTAVELESMESSQRKLRKAEKRT